MAFTARKFLYLVALALARVKVAVAGDPDILSDFVVSPDSNTTDSSYFTFTGMRALIGAEPSQTFKAVKASMAEFPALNGQSISFAVLEYPAGSVNPLHTHPRASELLFVIAGSLEVGFVDTSNKLLTKNLQVGDMFIFPKGLVHYQFNNDTLEPAWAVSAFGSASAGTVSVPTTVFNTSIYEGVLVRSFNTDVNTIKTIEAGLKA